MTARDNPLVQLLPDFANLRVPQRRRLPPMTHCFEPPTRGATWERANPGQRATGIGRRGLDLQVTTLQA